MTSQIQVNLGTCARNGPNFSLWSSSTKETKNEISVFQSRFLWTKRRPIFLKLSSPLFETWFCLLLNLLKWCFLRLIWTSRTLKLTLKIGSKWKRIKIRLLYLWQTKRASSERVFLTRKWGKSLKKRKKTRKMKKLEHQNYRIHQTKESN